MWRDAHRVSTHHQVCSHLLVLGLHNPDVGDRVGVEAIDKPARVAHARRRCAARQDHVHIGILEARAPHAFKQNIPHDIQRDRQRHAQPAPARLEPGQMIVETEKFAIPHRHHIIGDIRTGKPRVDNGNSSFGNGHIVAIDPRTTLAVEIIGHADFSSQAYLMRSTSTVNEPRQALRSKWWRHPLPVTASGWSRCRLRSPCRPEAPPPGRPLSWPAMRGLPRDGP